MTKGIPPELAGIAEVYGVEGETTDELLAGLSKHMRGLNEVDRKAFILANGSSLAKFEMEDNSEREADEYRQFEEARQTGASLDGDDESGNRGGKAAAVPSRMTREEMANTLWNELKAAYDVTGQNEGHIEQVAVSVRMERGYDARDFNDASMRREFIGQVADALGVKAKAQKGGKASEANRTAGLSHGRRDSSEGFQQRGGGGDSGMLRQLAEVQHKEGVRHG